MTIFRILARSGYVKFAIGAAAASALAVVEGLRLGLDASQWANWVQAAGATLAIALAVWLPHKDRANKARDEAASKVEEQRRICMAFRDELAILQSRFIGPNIVEILRDAPDEVFDIEIPIPQTRFPIYNAMIGKLAEIDDESLRHGIIEAYDYATSVVDVAAMNNRRLSAYVSLSREDRRNSQPLFADDLEDQWKQLVKLRVSLREIASTAIGRVNDVVARLDAAIEALRRE